MGQGAPRSQPPSRFRAARASVRGMSADEPDARSGMRLMFWAWMTLIVGGLTIMIVLPLAGR